MQTEDGEILDSTSGLTYDPAFEWPGELDGRAVPEDANSPHLDAPNISEHQPHVTFRLIVTQTSILPRKLKLVNLEGQSEVQIGRDVAPPGSPTPRIRLKEMEVSKLHATIYWDKGQSVWGIVDMGSKHGTFVRSSVVKAGGVSLDLRHGEDSRGARLSLPKVASIPKRLFHLDTVTIGSTSFLVHIHSNQQTCDKCSPESAHEVPLFPVSKKAQELETLKRSIDAAGLEADYSSSPGRRNPKKALTILKQSLLTRHNSEGSLKESPSRSYVDRSARRRAMHPGARPDAPGIPNQRIESASSTSTPPRSLLKSNIITPLPPPPVEPAKPPAPLPDSNIGHRLLMKQGWQPGSTLGLPGESSGSRLTEPIQVNALERRAGLGMPVKAQYDLVENGPSPLDWRVAGKQRRWDNLAGESR